MKFNMAKTENGKPIPATDKDKEKWSKVGIGEVFKCTTINQRNYEFHKKFFALIQIAFDNLPERFDFTDPEHLREELIKAAGFYELRTDFHGNEYKVAQSIAFDKMDEERFQVLYERVVDLVCRLIGFDKPDLLQEIAEQFG